MPDKSAIPLVRRVVDAVKMRRLEGTRWRLARHHLRGEGLEVGALHRPLRVPAEAHVRYVDRLDVAGLREHYPDLRSEELVSVDVVDDGETLSSQADASADFIIANHFLEHTEDPLGVLESHLRVLRPGGILYLAIPDRRRTFDRDRSPTGLEHVIRDHADGPSHSRRRHLEEWAALVEKAPAQQLQERVKLLDEQNYSIHFHVWTPQEFTELLEHARRELPFSVEELAANGHEFVAILRRS